MATTSRMTNQARPAVCLEGVSRTYGDFRAVDSLALVVNEGEFFSIIGPSGCGKTTTLRMIAGLESMTAGRILVAGRDISNEPAFRRPVNTVFQNYALFPHLSVYENVAFGLRERGEPRKAVKTTVHAMLELVGLTGREAARPRELSGGQQQRVALARALVLEPAVLLLDEPLGALDLKLRRQMQDVLKDIQRDTEVTFIYVTHDQEEAFSMSERVAVMNGGVLEQVGEPYDVYHRPCSLFVAEFVGASNPVAGTVVNELEAGRYDVRLPSVASPIALHGVLGLRRGDSVYALLRPEAAVLGELSGPGLSATGAVRDVSYFGPQVRYSIVASGVGDLSVVAGVDIRTGPLAPGAPLTISWEADGLWIVSSSEQPTSESVATEGQEQVDD